MNDVKKSLVSAGLVVAGIAAVIGGVNKRNAIDLGDNHMSLSGLVASADRDVQVPEAAYFDQLSDLLKNEYVDPISDEAKLVDGAVRGMVLSLEDSHSTFLAQEEFGNFQAAQRGDFEGIGVVLQFEFASAKKTPMTTFVERIPRLVVTEVAPGGPAEKGGVKVGDQVVGIDGYWVVNAEEVATFQKLGDDVLKKKASEDALLKARQEMRKKADHSLMPGKAIDRLVQGTGGQVKVTWRRAGKSLSTTLARSKTDSDLFRFAPGADKGFLDEVKSNTLDLRQNSIGDYPAMLACLSQVAPAGNYGFMSAQAGKKTDPFTIKQGATKPLNLLIKVDEGTRGAAEIFALALQSKGLAKLEGKTGGDPTAFEIVKLPSGAGYTLAIGRYKAGGTK